MEHNHKLKIEEIITDIKNNNDGFINSNQLAAYFDQNHKERIIVCGFMLDEFNLLDRVGDHAYKLSKNGWEFEGFEYLEFESRKLIEKNDAEFENLKISNHLNKWLIKTRWLPLILSLLAILITFYTAIFDKKDEIEIKILKNRIEKFEKILEKKNIR